MTCPPRWRILKPYAIIAPAGALAILLVAADTSLARCGRDAADAVSAAVGKDLSGRVAFCGHWGFHEYMQRIGGQPIDVERMTLQPGDLFVQPDDNTSVVGISPTASRLEATLEFQPMSFVSTMQPDLRAGFYSNTWGPLPFAFGHVPPEAYRIYTITKPLSARAPQPTK